jgi:hypothetical protein
MSAWNTIWQNFKGGPKDSRTSRILRALEIEEPLPKDEEVILYSYTKEERGNISVYRNGDLVLTIPMDTGKAERAAMYLFGDGTYRTIDE